VWGEGGVLLLAAAVGLCGIFLLVPVSPCSGWNFISFQTRKETKQRKRVQTANA
jgi:hypothetical protein